MTKDYLKDWFGSISTQRSIRLQNEIRVTGVRDQHCGPRWEYAKIEALLQPSDDLAVTVEMATTRSEFVDAAVFGLLDVLLVEPSSPLRNVRINILKIEEHPIDSSVIAFRHAGRDAARKALEAVKGGMFTEPGANR